MKSIKVFYMGRPLRDVYPHATKFQVFKWKVQEFLKKVLRFLTWTGITAGIAYSIFMAGAYFNPMIVHATDVQKVDSMPGRLDLEQDKIVDAIADQENKANIPSVPDDNKSKSLPLKDKVSYGCMQFKISTIQHYYGILKLGTISDQDAASLGIDCARSKELGKRIIFETDGGLWNWSVATKEMGTKVEVIKSLLK